MEEFAAIQCYYVTSLSVKRCEVRKKRHSIDHPLEESKAVFSREANKAHYCVCVFDLVAMVPVRLTEGNPHRIVFRIHAD